MIATRARLGAMLLMVVALLAAPAVADTPAKSDAQFFMLLGHKSVATLSDGYQAVAMLVRGEGKLLPPEECRTLLVERDIARKSWGDDMAVPLTKGKLAYMVCQALEIKGGLTMLLFGPSERYCLFECLHLDLMANGARYQHCTGGELVGVIDRSDEYQQEREAKGKKTTDDKATSDKAAEPVEETKEAKEAAKAPEAKVEPTAAASEATPAAGDDDVIEVKPVAVEPKSAATKQGSK